MKESLLKEQSIHFQHFPVSSTSSSQNAITPVVENPKPKRAPLVSPSYRFMYPEFLPDPKPEWRNLIREKLERKDMLARRSMIDMPPQFYVGSVLAVTSSDPHAAGKTSRFVGICIDRQGCGLRAKFILRNVVDHQGLEILYDMYDPTMQKIEVLRLEKRLDDKLYYLRDCIPEFSTFDLNMEPEILPEGTEVPTNPIKAVLKPRPWLERWERQDLKGIANLEEYLTDKMARRAKARETKWEKFDLMKEYRSSIPAEEQSQIYSEVYSELHQFELARKKMKRKRNIPSKLA